MNEKTVFRAGDKVCVTTFRGQRVERVVATVENGRVMVCTSQGYEALLRGEQADVIGFPKKDVEDLCAA